MSTVVVTEQSRSSSARAALSTKRKKTFSASRLCIYLLLSFWAFTTTYPFVWVLFNAFKKTALIRSHSFSIPVGEAFTLANFEKAFRSVNILNSYKNSLYITVTVTLVVILLAGFAAFALARYRFKGKKLVHSMIIASMMFPVFSTIIPVYRMEFAWGIANTDSIWLTYLSVALPQIAGNLAFSIIVLLGFIRGLPIELEEAAFLEGCSIYQIFFRVIVPIARPSFATVAIFTFLWSYNDLFTQMFFLRFPNQYTITRLLNEISGIAGTDYGMLAAAVVMVVMPVLIVYILLQKNIIKGMTAGAVKG